jgi:shikimate dehydrogenase
MGNQYGLIGFPIGHSFSKIFFEDKFNRLNSTDSYKLYELENINELQPLLKRTSLKGLNVTIPYKQSVISFLDNQDKSALLVGAVNVIKINNNELIGYNTDYPAFKATLKKWLDNTNIKGLVLGTGGASKAVITALRDLKIEHKQVSRTTSDSMLSYQELKGSPELIQEYKLIINTTPLGMAPEVDSLPDINYNLLTKSHYLYDLVYNPKETQFLKQGKSKESHVKNGLEMLHLQAQLAWEIWNS